MLAFWPLFIAFGLPPQAETDAAAIMAKVAANVERATDSRRQYVYQQLVRSSLVRSNGQIARKETRTYHVFPGEKNTEKKLVSFAGQYRNGKSMIDYSEPGFEHKGIDIDADLIKDLSEDLVNEKDSRDGIPHSLFPLNSKKLSAYSFAWKGESEYKGRKTYQIAFEPREKKTCVEIGGDSEGDCDAAWKGEAWIDAAELQPVRIVTDLAFKIPWGVRFFLGTNLRRTGFSINYVRVDENVWFPATYGTEFQFNVLWGYRRTVTLSLESSEFQKTDANSKIEYHMAGDSTP
jgi:hypothetical protein